MLIQQLLYFIFGFMYMLHFFKIICFFPKHCYHVFPVISMQRFDFKNSIIAFKLFLVMI